MMITIDSDYRLVVRLAYTWAHNYWLLHVRTKSNSSVSTGAMRMHCTAYSQHAGERYTVISNTPPQTKLWSPDRGTSEGEVCRRKSS